jgi:proteasome accessory factor C
MNVTERINRILFILSYVSKNQGVTIEKLAEEVGMRPKQLMKELDFMLLIGKPPFRPDDYVDIYVEEQQVYVEFDQMLNRPLRFTRPEAMALLMSLNLLDPEVDPKTVKSLRDTIEKAVSLLQSLAPGD